LRGTASNRRSRGLLIESGIPPSHNLVLLCVLCVLCGSWVTDEPQRTQRTQRPETAASRQQLGRSPRHGNRYATLTAQARQEQAEPSDHKPGAQRARSSPPEHACQNTRVTTPAGAPRPSIEASGS
jgi:hypothetical protein